MVARRARHLQGLSDDARAGRLDRRHHRQPPLARLLVRAELVRRAVPAHAQRFAAPGRGGHRPRRRHRLGRARHLHQGRRRVLDRSAALQLPVRGPGLLGNPRRPPRRHAQGRDLPGPHAGILEFHGPHRRAAQLPPERRVQRRQGTARPVQRGEPRLRAGTLPQCRRHQHGPAAVSILSREEAQALTQRTLGLSQADECRVSLTSGLQANTRFADNGVTTSGDVTNDAVVIRSSFGRRSSTATTNILTDEGLRKVVETSERIARLSPEDREWLPELGAQQYRDVPAFFERTAGLDPSGRADAANVCIEAARRAGCTTAGFIMLRAGATAVANNRGLYAYHRSSAFAMTNTMRTTDGTGSGWGGTAGNDWGQARPSELAEAAARKAQ